MAWTSSIGILALPRDASDRPREDVSIGADRVRARKRRVEPWMWTARSLDRSVPTDRRAEPAVLNLRHRKRRLDAVAHAGCA